MELAEEIIIDAPRADVYTALNDIEILKKCIPGCQELVWKSDAELDAKILLKIGPVKARFNGTVRLDRTGAPGAFSLQGEGNGGAAGFAKGGADVTLTEIDGKTNLSYVAKADIGGKIAQLGSRLIQSTAKKLSSSFFKCFARTFEKADEA